VTRLPALSLVYVAQQCKVGEGVANGESGFIAVIVVSNVREVLQGAKRNK